MNMMKKEEILQCQISLWYDTFRNITFQSKLLDLSKEVVDYLLADGVVMPEGCEEKLNRLGFEGDSDDEVDWDENTEISKAPNFPELLEQIEHSINALGGQVFPKLNWSSPKDAVWISTCNTLMCTCPRDLFLLIKSSDFVTHDLTDPFAHCVDVKAIAEPIQYQLVLREWHNMHPAQEFRCFVHDNTLIGISQRQHTAYFPSIVENKECIIEDLISFFKDRIQGYFTLSKYVFDVYLKENGRIYLVDFNPYGPVTDALLFSWEELLQDLPLGINTQLPSVKPLLRFVESEGQVQNNAYRCYSIPQDFVHLHAGEDPNKLIDFLKMRIQGQGESSSDSEVDEESSSNHNDDVV